MNERDFYRLLRRVMRSYALWVRDVRRRRKSPAGPIPGDAETERYTLSQAIGWRDDSLRYAAPRPWVRGDSE